jgi:hypothetical protein
LLAANFSTKAKKKKEQPELIVANKRTFQIKREREKRYK